MSLIAKLVIALVVAAVAATLTILIHDSAVSALVLFAAFCGATVVTALLVSIPPPPATASTAGAAPVKPAKPAKPAKRTASKPAKGDSQGPREQGEVKWFNMSKGFGFITKDDGEEVFVHFRSIRGEGRRGLSDGQRVSFVVAQSDKGPQAEDVEALE